MFYKVTTTSGSTGTVGTWSRHSILESYNYEQMNDGLSYDSMLMLGRCVFDTIHFIYAIELYFLHDIEYTGSLYLR